MLLAVILVTLGLTTWAPLPAHAAEDVVRRLATDYRITADGLLHVRQQIDWTFPETGRRGIEVDLVTAEVWDDAPSQMAHYAISDLSVSSPTGAPASFTTAAANDGDTELLRIRVGDPDVTLDRRDHTYVLSYTVAGALRTFDGQPELFWDVTSTDYPAIKEFTATITTPGGVPRSRCLVGEDECTASVTDGVATLSARDVPEGEPLSVVGALVPGSVSGAEPTLRHRSAGPSIEGVDSTFIVDPTGRLSVEHRLQWRLPATVADDSRTFVLPGRRPHTFTQDTLSTISNPRGRATGASLDVAITGAPPARRGDSRQLTAELHRAASTHEEIVPATVAYDVAGAVVGDGDKATLEWPVLGENLPAWASQTVTVDLPGAVASVSCGTTGPDVCPGWEITTQGRRVTLHTSHAPVTAKTTLSITFDGAALTGMQNATVARFSAEQFRGFGLSVLLFLVPALGGLAVRLRRKSPQDRAFVGLPPGVLARPGTPEAPAPRSAQPLVPVRFNPPQLDLASTGALVDRDFAAPHLAAVLTRWAAEGRATIRFDPLSVTLHGPIPEGDPTQQIAAVLPQTEGVPGGGVLDEPTVQRLVAAARSTSESVLQPGPWVHTVKPAAHVGSGRRVLGIVLLVMTFPFVVFRLLTLDQSWPAVTALLAIFFGLGLGLTLSSWHRRNRAIALTGQGTAVVQQALGFRQYIETAEADRLTFEADADIYARYLPWAVLFGLTERWTRVCQGWAAAGLIKIPNERLVVGLAGLDRAERHITSTRDRLDKEQRAKARQPRSSSGSSRSRGSGSRSGFRRSSRGGGGGGGSRSRSW